MAKYDPLRQHLRQSGAHRVVMSFDQVAALVGPLPQSAIDYREWWSNERGGSHVQSHAWQEAGYLVDDVNLNEKRVTFVKHR